jgi:3-phenylpropionate/trans-cinnamate dioxygenase ferredoxin subunit
VTEGDGASQAHLGDLSDLADGDLRGYPELGEYGIVVCRVGGRLYAFEDHCSHADTPLSDGALRGAMIVCPLHGAQFDVRDGSHQGPPAWEGIACYAVTEADGGVTVDLASDRQEASAPDPGGRLRTR